MRRQGSLLRKPSRRARLGSWQRLLWDGKAPMRELWCGQETTKRPVSLEYQEVMSSEIREGGQGLMGREAALGVWVLLSPIYMGCSHGGIVGDLLLGEQNAGWL